MNLIQSVKILIMESSTSKATYKERIDAIKTMLNDIQNRISEIRGHL